MEGALPLDVPMTVDLKVGSDWERMDRYDQAADGTWQRVARAPEPEPDEPALIEVGA